MLSDLTTILLVEDNDDDAVLTELAFREAHVDNPIVRARDGVEALDFLFARGSYDSRDQADLPAVVLLDLNLPRLGGLDVLGVIRSDPRTRHVPVVVLTSSAEEIDRLAAYDGHANSFVRKPVAYEAFLDAARQLGAYWLSINLPPPRRAP